MLAAATDLSARHGYMRSSSAEIGKAAGLSRGAVHFVYGTRAALGEAVLSAAAARWRDAAPAVGDAPTFGALLDQHWLAWTANAEDTQLALMTLNEAFALGTPLRPSVGALRAELETYVVDRLTLLEPPASAEAQLPVFAGAVLSSIFGITAGATGDPARLQRSYTVTRATLRIRWASLCEPTEAPGRDAARTADRRS